MKIIMFNATTVDGYFEGPGRDINWHNVDQEFDEFAIAQLHSADGLIFGRVTYQLMESYFPTVDASRDDPVITGLMNDLPKIVFSRTLDSANWNNTRLVKGDAVAEMSKLRQQTGRNLFIFGSANLCASLIPHGLIDEFRVLVNPVVLGKGRALFEDVHRPFSLKLLNTKTFGNGNVLLVYQPEKQEQ